MKIIQKLNLFPNIDFIYFPYNKEAIFLGQMYPPELEIKDTTEGNTSASYLDLLLSIGRDGQLLTSLYDKRDDFQFPYYKLSIPE